MTGVPDPLPSLPLVDAQALQLKATIVGEGTLDWPKTERVSARHGVVLLTSATSTEEESDTLSLSDSLNGQKGTLIAVVVNPRDNYRTICAATLGKADITPPKIGDQFELGTGEVFYENGGIGLRPFDDRDEDWMDPENLDIVHKQGVRLFFRQDTEATFGDATC